MWARPNIIPGDSNRTVHLPGDKMCPHCNQPYRKVNIQIQNGRSSVRCPHCDEKVSVKIPGIKKK